MGRMADRRFANSSSCSNINGNRPNRLGEIHSPQPCHNLTSILMVRRIPMVHQRKHLKISLLTKISYLRALFWAHGKSRSSGTFQHPAF